ncbi:agouti-related protein-like isoform X2 [Chiloscyllium plagiosum]|uniref:agouti-related protein-like isoform X2 n=1 Tax=Chiloscyllium plagiosum TaxID=36176 RepID=UPI001CB83AFC|nr:agouti-related protein-like isoform X2 [Chiloscyllium plagiosum]
MIMFKTLLLCYWILQMVPIVLASVPSRIVEHAQDSSSVQDVVSHTDLAVLSRIKTLLSASGSLVRPALNKAMDMVKEDDISNKIMLDPEAISSAVEKDRAERSPRRCVRQLESCFGHALPCCDPCAICYCRFFNAICYCRTIGNSCHQGKI